MIQVKHILLLSLFGSRAIPAVAQIAQHKKGADLTYVVSPENPYTAISSYSDGLARVAISADSCGFMDTNGRLVFAKGYTYNEVSAFHDGRAAVGVPVFTAAGKSGFFPLSHFDKNRPRQSALAPEAIVGLRQFRSVKIDYDPRSDQPILQITLNPAGSKALAEYSAKHIGQPLAIVLNGHMLSVAHITGEIPDGKLQINHLEPWDSTRQIVEQLNQKRAMKYGYIDTGGQVVIPFRYDKAKDFSDNRAAVYKDGHWQIINKKGAAVIDYPVGSTEIQNGQGGYDIEPPGFRDGLMPVQRNGLYGYIDTSGKLVIPYQYDGASAFNQGVALVARQTNETPQIDTASVLGKIYNSLPDGVDETGYHWAFINSNGAILYRFKADQAPEMTAGLSEGTIIFKTIKKEQGIAVPRYGIIDRTGKIVLPPVYDETLSPLSDGLAVAQSKTPTSDGFTDSLLVVDKNKGTRGTIALTTPYGRISDYTASFHEGLMPVEVRSKAGERLWGYINKKGEWAVPPMFETALGFQEGLAVVVTRDGRVAVIKNPLKTTKKRITAINHSIPYEQVRTKDKHTQ